MMTEIPYRETIENTEAEQDEEKVKETENICGKAINSIEHLIQNAYDPLWFYFAKLDQMQGNTRNELGYRKMLTRFATKILKLTSYDETMRIAQEVRDRDAKEVLDEIRKENLEKLRKSDAK